MISRVIDFLFLFLIFEIFLSFAQDGEPADDDPDEAGPQETDTGGRVEKYIGVKVKACTSTCLCFIG